MKFGRKLDYKYKNAFHIKCCMRDINYKRNDCGYFEVIYNNECRPI
jgi:hypothetical protein